MLHVDITFDYIKVEWGGVLFTYDPLRRLEHPTLCVLSSSLVIKENCMSITDLVTHFGDIIQLRDFDFDVVKMQQTLATSTLWKQYNPRKQNARFGLSVTSLDGGYSGVPDLDSLREYNLLHGTSYLERDFIIRTPICDDLGLNDFLDLWGDDLGRSHFLRLDAGGFFPYHRDNGLTLPPRTARIIVPIVWSKRGAIWLQEDRIVQLDVGQAYFINTTKEHAVFSFQPNTTLLVLNIEATPSAVRTIAASAHIL